MTLYDYLFLQTVGIVIAISVSLISGSGLYKGMAVGFAVCLPLLSYLFYLAWSAL